MFCSGCQRELGETDFYRDRTKPAGRASQCKDCRRSYHRVWRDRPSSQTKMAGYRSRYVRSEDALERRHAFNRQYYRTHADRLRADARAAGAVYYATHREEMIRRAAQWSRSNPDKRAAIQIKRRAQKRGLEAETVLPSVVYETDGYVCQLCDQPTEPNGPYGRRPSIDHKIPLSLGGPHTYANTQTAHRACNSAKGNRFLEASNPNGLRGRGSFSSPDTIRLSRI